MYPLKILTQNSFMMKWVQFFGIVLLFVSVPSFSQIPDNQNWVSPTPSAYIVDGADTLYCMELPVVTIFAYRTFSNDDDRFNYMRYQRHATIVYPYALEAVRTYKKLQSESSKISSSERKDKISKLQDELKDKFEKPLKGLSRTQGKVLIKMIEKELNTPVYDVIKDLRGGFTAFYWNAFGSLYGYKLKHGYVVGEDKILDLVLKDFDIPDNI